MDKILINMGVLTPVTVFEINFLLDTIVGLDSEFIVLWISASHQEEQKSVANNSFFLQFCNMFEFLFYPPPPRRTTALKG